MAENKVIPMYSKISLAELFVNMNRTQHELNADFKDCILNLNKKAKILQAFIVALTLTIITMGIGFTLALNKISKEPITIQVEDRLVDLDKLPLPPLEELK